MAVAHGVGRFIEAQKPSGEAADQHGQHEPRRTVPRGVELDKVGVEKLQEVIGRVTRRRCGLDHGGGGVEQERPFEDRHLHEGALGGLRQHVEAPGQRRLEPMGAR